MLSPYALVTLLMSLPQVERVKWVNTGHVYVILANGVDRHEFIYDHILTHWSRYTVNPRYDNRFAVHFA